MPNIQDQLSQSGIKLFTYNNTPGRVFAYAPSNNAIGMGGPSQIHEITDPNSLTSLGIDPNQIQKGENLSKQLGLTYYVNGPKGEAAHFYGVGGGANFNSQGLQGLLNQYAQNTASTNYQKQQEAQTLANQPHPFMGSPSDFVTPDQQLAADRQAKLERIGLQLKDVKNQVNKFGQGKPSVSTSPVGGLYSQEFSQNAPAKSVDTATASSYVAGAGTSSIVDEYQKAIDKNIQSQKDLNAQVSKGGLASLFGGQPQQIDYAQANKNALEALGLPADFTKVQVQKLQTNIDEMNDLNKKMVDLDKQEQQAKLNVEGQQIPMYNINKQTDELTRKFAVQKSSIAADITVKKAYGEALRGNFEMVDGLINKAISYATHQQDQAISDYKWMYDNYKSQMQDLTTKEQSLLEHQLTIMESERKLTQEDLRWKAEQYIKAGVQPPSMADLGKMNITDVARAVAGKGGSSREILNQLREANINLKEAQFSALTSTSAGQIVNKATGFPVKLTESQITDFQRYDQYLNDLVPTVSGLINPNSPTAIKTGGAIGRYMKTVQGLPLIQRTLSEPQNKLLADIATMKNQLIYMLSGKQINEQEYERLSDQLPDVTLTNAQNVTRINEFNRLMTQARDKKLEFQGLKIQGNNQSNQITQPDGTVWKQNADGSYTRIK